MKTKSVIALLVASIFIVPAAQAAPILLGIGSLSNVASDLSGLTNTLENGKANNLLGGMGSGIAYAGGNTFLYLAKA